jgi:transposase
MKRSSPVHTKQTRHVGIDVSKQTLQIDAGEVFQGAIPNEPANIAGLLEALRAKADIHLCCEATGPYDRPLVKTCQDLGLPVSRLNPARVKHYRKAKGMEAKTDKDDALAIRLFAQDNPPAPLPKPDHTRETLRQLHLLRDALVKHQTALQNLCASIDLPALRKVIDAELRKLEKRITKLDEHIQHAVDDADPVFQGLVEVVDAIKGMGLLSATKVIAHTPELGTLNRRGAAKLAGLAPFCDDSGDHHGPRHIRGGRKHVRDGLYMAAHSASIHNEVLRVVYQRLKAVGKHHNVALTAVMRKLFIYANHVAADYLRSLEVPSTGSPGAAVFQPGGVGAHEKPSLTNV